MITVLQYLQRKYDCEVPNAILNKEAKVFGIPVPLRPGWLKKHGETIITEGMFHQLVNALGRKLSNGNKFAIEAMTFIHEQVKVPVQQTKEPKKKRKKRQPKVTSIREENVKKFIRLSTINPLSTEFLSSFEWRSIRMIALKNQGSTCQCCGASPKTGAVMHVDHIKPRKLYPHLALDIDNLQVLCDQCNHGKGNWDQTDWR